MYDDMVTVRGVSDEDEANKNDAFGVGSINRNKYTINCNQTIN
jgi:hypothetical protein